MKLPDTVHIIEVGPRDGFQNINTWIPTETKIVVISSLLKAGIKEIELTSFVNPKDIPQMKDAGEIVDWILRECREYKDVEFSALVPNLKGAGLAWEAGIRKITYVISASWRHNQENVKRTIKESFADLEAIRNQYPKLKIKLAIATAFGCPFLGDMPPTQVIKMIDTGLEVQVDEISLADTIGVANPLQIEKMLSVLKERYPDIDFILHLHDTRGMGLANILVALQKGFCSVETAIGGLGGCPFAPGAVGNIATEDLVNMLEQMGIKTGVDLSQLLKASKTVTDMIGQNLNSHTISVN